MKPRTLLLISALVLGLGLAVYLPYTHAVQDTEPDLTELTDKSLAGVISYKHNLIVMIQDGAVAAVKFEETKPLTVKYSYRVLLKDKGEETVGSGELFDEPLTDKPPSVWIQAGPFKQQWSYSAPGTGWFYYEPEKLRMYIVGVDKFDKLNLKRFLDL